MKYFSLRKFLWGGALLTSLGSCDSFLDTNTNPNDPTAVTPELILPSAQNITLDRVGSDLNILGNIWVGNWAQAGDYLFYVPQQQYNLTPLSYDPVWTDLYAGSLQDLISLEARAQANGQKNFVAIAKIMQAYNFQILVDGWGNVPYTDAFRGVANLTPTYDNAQDVYDNLIVLLNDGIASIDNASQSPGASDVIFRGDMNKWRRFANTLKLRIYIRESQARESVARAGIASMMAANAEFLGSGEDVAGNPGYLNTAGKLNPLYFDIGLTTAGAPTSSFQATRGNVLAVNYLIRSGDTLRLKRLYGPRGYTPNGTVVSDNVSNFYGVASGVNSGVADYNSSRLSTVGPAIIKSTAQNGFATPVYLMNASESFFLRAEAVQRGYMAGDAKALYNAGIEESFRQLGLTVTAARAYYGRTVANPGPLRLYGLPASADPLDLKIVDPNFDTTPNKIEAIITQKWISLNGYNGFEAWSEFRRTGYPAGNYLSLNRVNDQFPVRIPYPQSELNNNPNVPKDATITGPRIFWDVN